MNSVSTYLNFESNCEEAFDFYKSVFGTDYIHIMRFGDAPSPDGQPTTGPEAKLVMNVQLPILGGHLLMGSDTPPGMGWELKTGNNFSICLHPASREESDKLYADLSAGGTASMPLADQFWGDYFGMLTDKFGINWMINQSPNRG